MGREGGRGEGVCNTSVCFGFWVLMVLGFWVR